MVKKSTFKYLAPFFILIGLLLYLIVKFYLRKLEFNNDVYKFILGVSPNFIFAFFSSITIGCSCLTKRHRDIKKCERTYIFFLVCIFMVLSIEEYYPFFSGSKTTDINDIVFSFLGIILGYFFYLFFKKEVNHST